MKTRKFFLRPFFSGTFFLVLIFLSSCATPTGVMIEETPLGISETRRNIVIVMGEPRTTSENGREMTSKFFDKKMRSLEGVKGSKERYVAHFIILNDRRPYDVNVEVKRQALHPGGYYDDPGEPDDEMARIIAEKIRAQLYQSRDNRNVIDDFKPY